MTYGRAARAFQAFTSVVRGALGSFRDFFEISIVGYLVVVATAERQKGKGQRETCV